MDDKKRKEYVLYIMQTELLTWIQLHGKKAKAEYINELRELLDKIVKAPE